METQYVGNAQVNHLKNFTGASVGDKKKECTNVDLLSILRLKPLGEVKLRAGAQTDLFPIVTKGSFNL